MIAGLIGLVWGFYGGAGEVVGFGVFLIGFVLVEVLYLHIC